MASRQFLITSNRIRIHIKSINPMEEVGPLVSAKGMTSHRESELRRFPPTSPQPKKEQTGSWYFDLSLSTATESKWGGKLMHQSASSLLDDQMPNKPKFGKKNNILYIKSKE